VIAATPDRPVLHESDSKHDTKLTNGAGSPKDVVKMAATKAKKEGKDPAEAAKNAIAKITKAAAKAGIKPGPKNIVSASAHMAKDAGHDPKKAAVKATKKIQHAAANSVKADPAKAKVKASSAPKLTAAKKTAAINSATNGSLHESNSKHDTKLTNGAGSPKDVVKMAATKAKKEGKDPAEAAKKAIAKISKAAAKAGIKPGPKNVVNATAHMAKDAGHDPKKAAVKATKKIQHAAAKKVVAADPTKAKAKASSAPKTNAASKASLHESDSKHNTVTGNGVGTPKDVVKMAATKAKKEGKDPAEAAKKAIAKISKAAAKAGIKPGPKNVAKAAAHMAHHAGHDPKKAAAKATKTIMDKAK
jgi:GTP cyclohydrolase I